MSKIDLSPYTSLVTEQLGAGASYRQIAEVLGVDHTTVSKYVRKHLPDLARPARGHAECEAPRLLVVDIETMANLCWTWGVWEQNIAPSQIVKHKRTISWAAKWVGEKPIHFGSEFHSGSRVEMIGVIWDLLDEADGVIGYNSKRFDIKHLNTEFDLMGLGPPSPFQHIDLLQVARREFQYGSNKLEAIAQRKGIGKKREHEGFALWVKCEAGDEDAWRRMRDYNKNDVKLTEQLFERWRPWIPLRGRQSQKQLRRLVA